MVNDRRIKVLKILGIVFVTILLFIAGFLTIRNPKNLKSSYALGNETYDVNFYGSDNETVLIDYQIPSGFVLNQNFLLLKNKSSDFNISSPDTYSISDLSYSGFSFSRSGSQYSNIQVNNFIFNQVGHYVLLIPCSDSSIPSQAWLYNGSSWASKTTYRGNGCFYVDFNVTSQYVNVNCEIGFQLTGNLTNFKVYSFGLVYSSYSFGGNLFDLDYLKQLYYDNYGDVIYFWSNDLNSYIGVDYSLPVFENKNFYAFVNSSYSYNSSSETGFTGLGSSAISQMEYVRLKGGYLIHYQITNSSGNITLFTFNGSYFSFAAPDLAVEWFLYNSNNPYVGCNFFIKGNSSSTVVVLDYLSLKVNNGTFDLYISNFAFISDGAGGFTLEKQNSNYNHYLTYDYTENLDYFVDFNTATNFEFSFDGLVENLLNDYNNTMFYNLLLSYTNSLTIPTNNRYGLSSYSVKLASASNVLTYNNRNFIYYCNSLSSFVFNRDIEFYITSLDFNINDSALMVNNTLMIYQFDNSILTSVSNLSYRFMLDGNLFSSSISSLPTDRYVNIYSSDIQDLSFSKVVRLYIAFDNLKVNYLLNEPIKAGFDFNFIFYSNPLITNNGSYNFSFEKPGYKDGSIYLSLTPPKLVFPIEAWVYNAVVFLVFYCPIISDLLNLMHLDIFIGGLLRVVDFIILDNNIGQFVLAVLAFLLFFGILKGLMPTVLTTVKGVYNNSQFAYNKKRNREDKEKEILQQKEIKYTEKMIKFDEKYNRKHKK